MIQIKNRFTSEVIMEVPNLHGTNLCGADLCGADLRGANLHGTNLCGADLRGADLRGANLHGANLRGADLREACLRGADLSEASLRYTDLRGADLREACLRGADLSGADLRRARGLIYAQISFAGHGERGRRLLAVKIDEQVIFFCGCFSGTEADLRVYIENGEENLKASRIFALETCLKAIEFQPNY